MRWFLKVQSSTNQVYADTKRCVDSNICSSLKVPVETFLCISRYVLFLLDYLSQYLSKVKPLLDQNEVSASFFLFLFFLPLSTLRSMNCYCTSPQEKQK